MFLPPGHMEPWYKTYQYYRLYRSSAAFDFWIQLISSSVRVDEVPATMPKINDDDAGNPFASCDNDDSEPTVRGTLLVRLTS